MGHSIRSREIIDYLSRNHEIDICGFGKSYSYLKNYYEDVYRIYGVRFVYKNNRFKIFSTTVKSILNSPKFYTNMRYLSQLIDKKNPDVIVTDGEPLAVLLGKMKQIPVISVDNITLLARAHFNGLRMTSNFYFKLIRSVLQTSFEGCQKYVIMSIADAEVDNKTVLIEPVIRKELHKLNPEEKDYVLAYQSSDSNKDLLKILADCRENFIVYGFDKEKKLGNILLKKFNEKEFFEHLRCCKAVITNGGFSLLTESIYLKKPLLCIPIENQYEQIISAYFIRRLGFGECYKRLTKFNIGKFLANLSIYKSNLKRAKKYNTEKSLIEIEKIIDEAVNGNQNCM